MIPQPPPPPPIPHPPPHEPRIDYENGGLDPEKHGDPPILILVMNIINTVTQLVLGIVTIFALMLANVLGTNISSSLVQHIYLCTIGYILLMSQAVLTLNPYNGWSQTLKRHHKRTIHWVMQIVGSVLAIAGSIVRINGVANNFGTAHGILGLIAMLLTLLSLVGGVINLFCCHDFKIMKVFHACTGILTLSVAYLSLIFGFQKNIFFNILGETNSNLAISFAVIGFIGTVISAFSNIFRRIFS